MQHVIGSEKRAEQLTELLKGISHPLRLRIVFALSSRDYTVSQLADLFQTTSSSVSRHMAVLRMLRFVNVDRTGGMATYTLVMEGLSKVLAEIAELPVD